MVLCYSSSRILRGFSREVISNFVLTDYCCAMWKVDLGERKFGGGETCLWEIVVARKEGRDGGEGI